jgi:hypothetical protein
VSDPFFELPGPRRFAQGLRDLLGRGTTVTVRLPAATAPPSLRRATLPGLRRDELRSVRLRDLGEGGSENHLAAQLASELGLEFPVGTPVDATSLATATSLGRTVVWVEVRPGDPPELVRRWLALVGRYADAVKNRAPSDRPTLVTAITGAFDGLPTGSDDQVEDVWWWGVLDRVDTLVHVAERTRSDRRIGPDLASMIVEVAAHDLDLADTLIERWDGDVTVACELLAAHAEQRGWNALKVPPMVGEHDRPPELGSAAWHAGALERWEPDGTQLHGACDGTLRATVESRIWRAQLQTVFPDLERLRRSLSSWVAENAALIPQAWADSDPKAMELGELKDLVEHVGVLRHDQTRREALRWATKARNDLAHLRPLDGSNLRRGRKLARDVLTADGLGGIRR